MSKFLASLLLTAFALPSLTTSAFAARAVALIYHGPGSCDDEDADCSLATAQVVRKSGLIPRYVAPDGTISVPKKPKPGEEKSDDDVDYKDPTPEQLKKAFAGAKVWVQPGGVANEALYTMSEKLSKALKNFIKNGGGYVGFCAGAFMATDYIGGTKDEGLGIIPGWSPLYHGGYALEEVKWQGKKRTIYYEGGPYFYGYDKDPKTPVEVTATYETGDAAAIRASFGKGRVWVTGLHPEAPLNWTEDDSEHDPDGIEQFLAVDMIRWAAGMSAIKHPTPVKIPIRKKPAVKKPATSTRKKLVS
ncbi:MAG: hypothetical protein JST80_13680 [Bdellovibrionales bacterium]|nr:hypothetical protein [Bdellovibrionales bacterium]